MDYIPKETHCKRCDKLYLRKTPLTRLCDDCSKQFKNRDNHIDTKLIHRERVEKARRLFLPKKEAKKPFYTTAYDKIRTLVHNEITRNGKEITTKEMKHLYPLLENFQINDAFISGKTGLKIFGIQHEKIEHGNYKFTLVDPKKQKPIQKEYRAKTFIQLKDMDKEQIILEYQCLKENYGLIKKRLSLEKKYLKNKQTK